MTSTFNDNLPDIAKLFVENRRLHKLADNCARSQLWDMETDLTRQANIMMDRAMLIDPATRDGFLPEHYRAINNYLGWVPAP